MALFTDADVFAGTERHLIHLARGLKILGIEVSVACPAGSPVAKMAANEQMNVIPIEKRGLVDSQAIGTLSRRLREGDLDIVHAHNGRTAFLSALARMLARRGRIIATQHFLKPAHTERSGAAGWLSRTAHSWMNRTMDHFIAISEAARKGMFSRKGVRAGRMTVVPNGIPIPDRRRLRSRSEIRTELAIADSQPMIVCVARLEPEKDILTLIAAMDRVVKKIPDAVCVVAGQGSERERLETKIRELGLTQKVRLLGFVSDALSLIDAADLFVLPSLAEPFGLVLLEAMALAKPVIATQAGGPLEIVVPGETGLLVPPSDPEMLSGAICAVLQNPVLAQSMGRNGEKRFRDKFTLDRMAKATAEIYLRL